MLRRCVWLLCLLSLVIVGGSVSAVPFAVVDATPGWTQMGLNPGGALGVNNSGQAVGAGYNPSNAVSDFYWNGSTVTDLGKGPFSNQARAYGINDANTIVGWGLTPGRGWYQTSGGTMTQLPVLASGTASQALTINNAGEIGGYSNGPGVAHAVVWNNSTGSYAAYDLIAASSPGTWFASGNSKVWDLNDSGKAVGGSNYSPDINPPHDHAFYSSYSVSGGVLTATMTDLHAIFGLADPQSSQAYGINDHNQIVGAYGTGVTPNKPFLYTIGGSKVDLPYLGTGTYAIAQGINNSGWEVGYSFIDTSATTAHAFLYRNGTMTDLNDMVDPASGWVLNYAWAVSNAGYIAGRGTYNGTTHGFVLSAMRGDADLDGTVNITDLSKVLTNYDKTGMGWDDGDFNGDGTVNIADLSNVLTNYDKTNGFSLAGARAVPEPSALLLLAVGLVGLLTYYWSRKKI
jgi:probable HAF family extracellular repeat protein